MPDLYETLGVAKDATREAIKKAFRRKAKDAHPDTGGSPEKFHALELAHRILVDDDARARYDRDGSTEAEPDNTDAQAMSIIASNIDRLMNDEDAKFKDLVGEVRKALKSDIATAERNIGDGRKFELKAVDLRKRVKGGKGAALIQRMFDSKLKDAAAAIASIEKQIAIRRRALELLDDASFDAEKRVRDPYMEFAAQDIRRMQEEMATNAFYGKRNSFFSDIGS